MTKKHRKKKEKNESSLRSVLSLLLKGQKLLSTSKIMKTKLVETSFLKDIKNSLKYLCNSQTFFFKFIDFLKNQ